MLTVMPKGYNSRGFGLLIQFLFFTFTSNSELNKIYKPPFYLTPNELEILLLNTHTENPLSDLGKKIFSSESQKECVSLNETCEELGISCSGNSSILLSLDNIKDICLFSMKNILTKECNTIEKHKSNNRPPFITNFPFRAWGFTFLAVTLISLCSLNGCILYPLINKKYFKKLIMFLMAFATGVLLANGVLQLLANSLGFDSALDQSHIPKLICVLVGIYFFVIFEVILKAVISWHRGIPMYIQLNCHGNHIQFSDSQKEDSENSNSNKTNISNPASNENENEITLGVLNKTENKDNDPRVVLPKHNKFYQPVCCTPSISTIALLIICGDFLHNLIDGIAIGSSFAESLSQGLSVSIAVFCEEFCHEIGDFVALLASGMTVTQALFWNFISSLSCYIGCVIGLKIGTNEKITQLVDGFCAGMFIYISLVAMIPEIFDQMSENSDRNNTIYVKNMISCFFGFFLGMLFMVIMAYISEHIKISV